MRSLAETYDEKEWLAKNVTVIVNSCDKYEDLWYPFFEIFRKNWEDCPCEIILNTESKNYVHPEKVGNGITCLQLFKDNPGVDWSTRYIETLKHIKTKYVFAVLDDAFFTDKVNGFGLADLIKSIDKIKDFGAVYFSFPLHNLFKDKKTGLNRFTKWTLYRIVCFAAIWSKEKLVNTLRPNESPWEYELYSRERELKNNTRYFSIDDNLSPIHCDFYAQICKGKWSERCVKLLQEQGVDVDFERRGVIKFEPKQEVDSNYPFKKIWRKVKYNIWPIYCFMDWLAYLRRGKAIQ